MRMNLNHVVSGHFVLGRDVLCEFDYLPLAVSMPPTKVCPQCKAAVPVRRRHVNTVITYFDPNEKQSVICERSLYLCGAENRTHGKRVRVHSSTTPRYICL